MFIGFVVLQNGMLALAMKLADRSIPRILITMCIFDVVLFLDIPLLLRVFEGACR